MERRAGYSADDKSWEVMVLKTGSSSKHGNQTSGNELVLWMRSFSFGNKL